MDIVTTDHSEANEFIKRYISTWGEDEVDYLIASGYVPVKLSTGKWAWLLAKSVNPATVNV